MSDFNNNKTNPMSLHLPNMRPWVHILPFILGGGGVLENKEFLGKIRNSRGEIWVLWLKHEDIRGFRAKIVD